MITHVIKIAFSVYYTQDIKFDHPGTENRRKESIPIRRDKYCLIFNGEGL